MVKKIKLFDNVILKSGKTATIVELVADGVYVVDIKQENGDFDTDFINESDIEDIIS